MASLELRNVAVQVLAAHPVVNPDVAPIEQGPEGLHPVGVRHIAYAVGYGLVGPVQTIIRRRLDGGGRSNRGSGRRCYRISPEGSRNGPTPGVVRGVVAGQLRLPTEAVNRVFDRIRSGATAKQEIDLTPREREILVSFSRGMSYTAIAKARGVKVVTIRNAIFTIQVRLGLNSRQEAVVWAVRNGLLDD